MEPPIKTRLDECTYRSKAAEFTLYSLSFWYQTSSSSSGGANVGAESKLRSSRDRDKIRRRDIMSLCSVLVARLKQKLRFSFANF